MKLYSQKYLVFVGLILIFWVLASGGLYWYDATHWSSKTSWWNWGTFLFAVGLCIYIPFSIRKVRPDEIGAVSCLGWILTTASPGPVFVPRGIFELILFPGTVQEFEVPGEPADVLSGKVAPLRVTTGFKDSKDHRSPLDNQQTVEVNYYIRYRIFDAPKFIKAFNSISGFERQAEDTSTRVLQREFGRRTLADIIAGYGDLNDTLVTENEKLVTDAGIDIVDAGIKHSDPSHGVNKSLANLTSSSLEASASVKTAEGQKQAEILRGEGKKSSLVNEGEGRAKAEKALLVAQAEGFEETIKKLKLDATQASDVYRTVIAASALEKVQDVRIISGGQNPLGTMLGLVGEAAADIKRSNSATPSKRVPAAT